MFESRYLKCPVTSLKIFNQYLLSGQGSSLVIYSLKTNRYIARTKVFAEARIHKFVESKNDCSRFIVIGGKSVCCLQIVNSERNQLSVPLLTNEITLQGWIWDAHWQAEDIVYLISAHNTVLQWNVTNGKVIPVSSCTDQCILYSATFGILGGDLVVASGTVFNKVLLWKPSLCNKEHCFVNTWKSFAGHDGVIFRIRFHSNMKTMLSVSDDRSICIWSIDMGTCLNVLYGHSARVWDACYTEDFIVSIGEDTVCIVWHVNGSILRKITGHQGKSIWSLVVDREYIITGGGDGGIRKYSNSFNHVPEVSTDTGANIILNLPEEGDYSRILHIYENGANIITTTNNGCVWKYSLASSSWSKIFMDKTFASYCVGHVYKKLALYVIGNLYGHVHIISLKSNKLIYNDKVLNGKIHSIKWLVYKNQLFLLVSGPDGIIKLYTSLFDNTNEDITVELISIFILPYSKQRWITCGETFIINDELFLVCGDRRGSIHLFQKNVQSPIQSLIGVHGKTGVTYMSKDTLYYHIYTTGRDGIYQKYILQNGKLERLDKQKACKGMDWLEGLNNDYNNSIMLYGFYKQSHFLCWNTEQKEKVFQVKCGGGYRAWDVSFVQKGSGVEGDIVFAFMKDKQINICINSERSLGTSAVVEESLHGKDVMKTKILFDFQRKNERYKLVGSCSEDSTMNFYIYRPLKEQLIRIHTVVGHIGGVKNFETVVLFGRCFYQCYLISCGSRTSLKIWKIQFEINNNLDLDDSNTTMISDRRLDFATHFSCSLLNEIYNPEMKASQQQFKDMTFIDDMRFMDCKAFLNKGINNNEVFSDSLWILCACSDGYARIYFYWRNTFELAFLLDNHRHCIQTVNYVITDNRDCYIIISATDGFVTFWKLDELFCEFISKKYALFQEDHVELEEESEFYVTEKRTKFHALEASFLTLKDPQLKLKCHQSGVNDVAVKYYKRNLFLLTSGDDNALFYATIELPSFKLLNNAVELNAHVSSVTGVSFISQQELISTSIDQRVKLWKVTSNEDLSRKSDGKMSLLKSTFTNVADVKNLYCTKNEKDYEIIVCGVGLEILKLAIELNSNSLSI